MTAEIAVYTSLVLATEAIRFVHKLKHDHEHLHDKIKKFETTLKRIQAHFRENEGMEESSHSLKARDQQIEDVAYDIENVIDEFMSYVQYEMHPRKLARIYYKTKQYFTLMYSHISSKMDDIQKKIDNIKELDLIIIPVHADVMDQGLTSSSSRSRHEVTHDLLEDEEIVGFKDPIEDLGHHLAHRGVTRKVTISVVGSPGSGKTVLVNNVYKSKEVQRQFDSCAWVHVTHPFNDERILDNVLQQFCSSRQEQIPQFLQGGKRETLRNYLQTKRYLVVFDDIKDENEWKSIKNAFPKNSYGSRIIVTTRNTTVASSCVESDHCILELTALSRVDAWYLFCKKAFWNSNGGQCDQTVEVWAKKIFEKCEGLPLAIVVVAGLLSQKQLRPREWQKLHDSLGSAIQSHFALNYKDLTSELKRCFLYFCTFPGDHKIGSNRLIRLWVAERFVEGRPPKTAEEVAEEYLNELIKRNLVQVVRSDYGGQIRRCRVQKLMLEYLLQKAEEVNFVSVARNHQGYGEKVRRLSVHDSSFIEPTSIEHLSCLRSLFLFKSETSTDEVIILSQFKFLRVLDMQGATVDKFPEDILLLTLLRYLSLRNTGVETIPKKIKNLTFLETLDLRKTKVTELPAKIVRLVHLRHLFVYSSNVRFFVAFDSARGVKLPHGIEAFTNLQKLSLVKVDKSGKIIKALEKLTQLRKLGLLELKTGDGENLCKFVHKMRNLTTLDVSSINKDEILDLEKMPEDPPYLQHLHLKGRLQKVPEWIPKLHNLFKISLMWSRLKDSPLGYLQDLPNLMELQMVDTFCFPKLIFEAGKFKKLYRLSIAQFDELDEVIIGEGAIPELRKLTLSKCKNMNTLPLGINNLACLEMLLLYQMPDEFIRHLKSTEGKEMVSHNIPVIHSFTVGEPLTDNSCWSFENLS